MAEAAQAAGNVFQGVASYESGKYNRDAANIEAINAERDGTVDEARIRDAARMAMGAQVASQGENGFQAGSGSALDALHQSAINAAIDGLTARRQATARARSLRAQGAISYAQGANALTSAMIGASASAISANGDWASAKAGQSGGMRSSGGGGGGGGIVMGGQASTPSYARSFG